MAVTHGGRIVSIRRSLLNKSPGFWRRAARALEFGQRLCIAAGPGGSVKYRCIGDTRDDTQRYGSPCGQLLQKMRMFTHWLKHSVKFGSALGECVCFGGFGASDGQGNEGAIANCGHVRPYMG